MLVTKEGKITEVIDRYTFTVLVEPELLIHATVSKSMIIYRDKELKIGDIVRIQYNTYDPSKGRIHRTTFINFSGE
jgi:translation initiation factor IF-1